MKAAARRPDAGEVSAMLARNIQTLVEQLLSAGRRDGRYWKVGSLANDPGGSMWVHLHGPRQGRWQDAATGEFGDALDLVAQCLHRGDKRAAYQWSLTWLGLAGGEVARTAPSTRPARAAANDDQDVAARRKYALGLWLAAEPSIAHTPVAAYLRGRAIDLAELGRQPRALRYHRSLYHAPSRCRFPAMVAAISGPDGQHIATHRTWLEYAGGGWIKARVDDPKRTIAPVGGGSIRLSRGASRKSLKDAPEDEPVVIGEGIETCLSIAIACPELRVISAVSGGNLGSVWLPPQIRMVVLAIDNDTDPESPAKLQRAVNQHLDAGRHVRIARSPLGNDFNDTLRGWA